MEPRPKTPCRVWVVRECDHDRQDIVAIYTTAAEAQADCERRQAEHCAAVEAGDAWPLDFDVEEHRITPSATAPQPS